MVQLGFRDASANIVQGPHLTEYLKVSSIATVAYMVPGALVMKGSTDYDVSENIAQGVSANKPIGFLGYEEANANFKPTTRETAYAAGDEVPVHNGGGFRIRAKLAAYAGAVAKGEPLDASANGTLQKRASTTSYSLASAAETKSDSTSIQYIWVISHI